MSDAWDRLWTPHRMVYIKGEGRPTHTDAGVDCPFCVIPTLSDGEGLIIARGELVYAVLNLYPYNSGHLMVCPYRHVPEFSDLTTNEIAEFGHFTQLSMRALRRASSAQGFNIGMNQGAVAGAGIAGHLHQHVVPRWAGDTNFMPVIAGVKTMPQLLEDTRELIVAEWGL